MFLNLVVNYLQKKKNLVVTTIYSIYLLWTKNWRKGGTKHWKEINSGKTKRFNVWAVYYKIKPRLREWRYEPGILQQPDLWWQLLHSQNSSTAPTVPSDSLLFSLRTTPTYQNGNKLVVTNPPALLASNLNRQFNLIKKSPFSTSTSTSTSFSYSWISHSHSLTDALTVFPFHLFQ